MFDILFSILVFGLASASSMAFLYFHTPFRLMQQVVVVLLGLLLFVLYSYKVKRLETFYKKEGKWLVIYIGVVLVQLIIIASGGVFSPFFILVHLMVLGLSIVLGFYYAMLFFTFTFFVLVIDTLLDQTLLKLVLNDPGTPFLYLISLLVIIPIVELLARQYRIKDTIAKLLEKQITVEEVILATVDEMIFVIDQDSQILSVNDAVEQVLRRPRVALLHKKLFDVLYLRDEQGQLLNEHALQLSTFHSESTRVIQHLFLLKANFAQSHEVSMKIKPIADITDEQKQFTIIVTGDGHSLQTTTDRVDLSEAHGKHDALLENFKRALIATGKSDLHDRLVLITKIEHDMLAARIIEEENAIDRKMLIDIASLCKDTIKAEQDLAHALRVSLDFALPNFGEEDIKPLLSGNFRITPAQLTGPFFTVESNLQLVSILIKRLADIGIMLASEQEDPLVILEVERQGTTQVIVRIRTGAPALQEADTGKLLIPYYEDLGQRTNLKYGSGLEGYLVKTVLTKLGTPLTITLDTDKKHILFSLVFNRSVKA